MREGKDHLYFCCAEKDSLYAMECMRKEKEAGNLTELEIRQLRFMEKRTAESRIYLAPSVIYAAANQKSCVNWLLGKPQEMQEEWYQKGIAWMRRNPAFLEKFGWRERKCALLTAGILSQAENTDAPQDWNQVCQMLAGGWTFLWEKMKKINCLDAEEWENMTQPWKDSSCMDNGMAGVLLLMAVLLEKPVLDRDKLWRNWQKLRSFSIECVKAPAMRKEFSDEIPPDEDERIVWLLNHFKNPQKPAYIQERTRIGSHWLDQLHQIMALAGLPVSACETMSVTGKEVQQLLDVMEERLTERQYMTFLMLYVVSRELAQAGRAAAAADIPKPKR